MKLPTTSRRASSATAMGSANQARRERELGAEGKRQRHRDIKQYYYDNNKNVMDTNSSHHNTIKHKINDGALSPW